MSSGCVGTGGKICETRGPDQEQCCEISGAVFAATITGQGSVIGVGGVEIEPPKDADIRYRFSYQGEQCQFELQREPKEAP